MLRAPRLTPFVILGIAVSGCPEPFEASTGGSSSSSSTGGSTGGTASTGGDGGSSSSSGGGTGGGMTCDDADRDGDGYSECALDCDDDNAFVHPGALEIRGDGADEDCDGIDNLLDECNAYSTYVSPNGMNGATGTRTDPVATIAEGIEHAMLLGVPAAVLVAAGTYSEDITVTGAVSLVGGYDPFDWAVRDPAVQPTILKSTTVTGLKLSAVDGEMLVDGFTIYGRNVSSGSESSAAVTVDGGGPVISGCKINGGQITMGTGQSAAVRIVEDTAAGVHTRLWSSTLLAGSAVAGPSYGVEIDADLMDVTIVGTSVSAAKGVDSVALRITSASKVTVWKSSFQSATATGSGAGDDSDSFGVWAVKCDLVFDSSFVNADQFMNPPQCFTPGAWCGGVRLSTGVATLTNNVILGSASESLRAAIHLHEDAELLSGVVVASNTLSAAGHAGSETESACVLIGSPKDDPVVTAVGRFRNNILFGGFAVHNYGVFEDRTPNESCDPAELDHDLFYFPVNLPNEGVLYANWNGIASNDFTLPDELPGAGDHVLGDPKLDLGHIGAESPCRNTGTDADAPNHDIDQQPRPQEGLFDIGPDEYVPDCFVSPEHEAPIAAPASGPGDRV